MTETKKPEEQQATKKSPVQRKFKLVGGYIARCSYILPNKLQCWKAGEEEVLEEDTSTGRTVVYQLCERHARIQRAIDSGAMKPEVVATAMSEMITEAPPSSPDPKDEKAFEGIIEVEPYQEVEPAKVPPKSEEAKPQTSSTQQQGSLHQETKEGGETWRERVQQKEKP